MRQSVFRWDSHSLHIREHKAVLADPDLRMDAELVQRTLTHIQEHINILSNPDVANILTLLGEQPIGPPMGSPVSLENAAPEQPMQQGQEQIPPLIENPQAQSVAVQENLGPLPAPAAPAGQGTVLPEQPTQASDIFTRNL